MSREKLGERVREAVLSALPIYDQAALVLGSPRLMELMPEAVQATGEALSADRDKLEEAASEFSMGFQAGRTYGDLQRIAALMPPIISHSAGVLDHFVRAAAHGAPEQASMLQSFADRFTDLLKLFAWGSGSILILALFLWMLSKRR